MVGAVALAVSTIAALVVLGRIGPTGLSAAAVQDAVRGAGVWAPALFLVLQVLVTVPPVPRTIFTVAAGLLFGSALGVAVEKAIKISPEPLPPRPPVRAIPREARLARRLSW